MKELEMLLKKVKLEKFNQDDLMRDIFAILAFYRLTEDHEVADLNNGNWPTIATVCYAFSDTMMKERANWKKE